MSGLSLFYTLFAYVAIGIFLYGFLIRIWKYATAPSPWKIPLTPGPVTSADVAYRTVQEGGFFKSLFYSNRIIWLDGYAMYLGLALVLINHFRFFFTPAPASLSWITTFEAYAGFIFLLPLFYLLIFITHFSLVTLLLSYSPFGKLMHAGSIFFSPTRDKIGDSWVVRHITPWALEG